MVAEVIDWAVFPAVGAAAIIGWRLCTGRWPQCFRRWARWALWKAAGSPQSYSLGRYDPARVAHLERELGYGTHRSENPWEEAHRLRIAAGILTPNEQRERARVPPYAPATHITVLMSPKGLVFLED